VQHSLATEHGLVIGTPGYMAPEIALSATVDGRADLYSVGCVAYYLLTGRQVFEAESAMQVFAQHLQAEPAPPSQKAPGAVPKDLDRLVLACLAKRPDDRPRSAAELGRRLALADAPWTDADAHRWWTTNASSILADGTTASRAGDVDSGRSVTQTAIDVTSRIRGRSSS
jgi:serine/threonine-protein kinase